jgi:membrane-associated phospholipid phosphatase
MWLLKNNYLHMKRLLAVSASVILHPMLMPLYGMFIIFNSGTHISFIPLEYRRMVYAIVFASSCVLPITVLVLLKQLNLIKSFNLETTRERLVPLFFTGLFYFLGFLIIKRLHLPLFLNQFIISTLIAILAALVVNFWWKISIHMLAIGGVAGIIIALSVKMGLGITPILITILVFSGIVGCARLYLNAHTPLQVFAGFFLGLLTVMTFPFL